MSRYIKSHSNYTLRKQHQLVKNGTIFERDWVTIGGTGRFTPGQTPIYSNGNFIFAAFAARGLRLHGTRCLYYGPYLPQIRPFGQKLYPDAHRIGLLGAGYYGVAHH